MAESAPGPWGPDRAGSDAGLPAPAGGPSWGKAAIPGAAPLRSPLTSFPQDAPDEGSDGGSETSTSSVTPSEEEGGHQWEVGDACITAWAGDGLLYPARLRALDPATGTCLVEFDGYGNTEERVLADLLPPGPGPWGGSNTPGGEGPHAESHQLSTPSSWELPPGVRRRKGKQGSCSPWSPEVMPPLWPLALLHSLWEEEEEEDALTAMLMAWYMSGYHTGFYMGLQEGRVEAAKLPLRQGHTYKKLLHS
ncbi:survival motor neuron protein 1-like [Balearica regulorum gibbericeps]|uniref:survival motor neuron protein 1-like n=1 Tax=Balearica regulorum gibbericeps TaxID=100784 RepID=UPI003F619303